MDEGMDDFTAEYSVLMVGPDVNDKGGIATFLRNLQGSGLTNDVRMFWYVFPGWSWREGGRWLSANSGDGDVDVLAEPGDATGSVVSRGILGVLRAVEGMYGIVEVVCRAFLKQVDIVHVQTSTYLGFYEKVVLCGIVRLLGFRAILHIQGADFPDWFEKTSGRRLAGLVLQRLDAVVCLNDEAANVMDEGHVVTIPNGVDLPDVPPSQIEGNVCDEGPIRILSLSMLVERKRISAIIRGFRKVLNDRGAAERDVILMIAGSGPTKEDLQSLTEELGLVSQVEFPGWVGGDALGDLWQRTHIFVSASERESFGLSQAEALGRGKIVVATRTGMAPEVIDSGANGYLLDESSPAELQRGLEWALGRVDDFEYGDRNWRVVKERYGWSATLKRLRNLYEEVYRS